MKTKASQDFPSDDLDVSDDSQVRKGKDLGKNPCVCVAFVHGVRVCVLLALSNPAAAAVDPSFLQLLAL